MTSTHAHGLAHRTRRRVWLGAILGIAFVLGLSFASSAHAYFYYANNGTNTIARANVDGTGANQSFIAGLSNPLLIAVNAQHIFWSNGQTSISRANLDGTGVNTNFIAGASWSAGVAVDAGHIYWANRTANTIGRANLNGTGVNQSFISGASSPFGLVVDAGHVVQRGTHAELVDADGPYARLHASWRRSSTGAPAPTG